VAEIGVNQDFWPDTISADLHIGSADAPAYDLPAVTVMSRPSVQVCRLWM
jgi:predicted amidohydrolase